jgi:hypothetical protein
MYSYSVNSLAVLLLVIASMVIGSLWYSPFLFGTIWMKLVGMTPEMKPEIKKTANKAYALMLIPSLVMAYVLALIIKNMFIRDLGMALLVGFFIWLGFVATTGSSEYIFNAKPKPWTLYLINVSYQLVNILVGACIVFWLR